MFEIVVTLCALTFCETHYIATSAPNELICQHQVAPEVARLIGDRPLRVERMGCERSRWLG